MRYGGAAPQSAGPGMRDWLFPAERRWALLGSHWEPCGTKMFACVLQTNLSTSLPGVPEPGRAELHCSPPRKQETTEFLAPTTLAMFLCGHVHPAVSVGSLPPCVCCPALAAEVAQGPVQRARQSR